MTYKSQKQNDINKSLQNSVMQLQNVIIRKNLEWFLKAIENWS